MDSNVKEILIQAGLEVDETLQRFANQEAIYKKFLKLYLNEPTVAELSGDVASLDDETFFRAIHTMKGVTANLGITSVNALSCKMVDAYRATGRAAAMEFLDDFLKTNAIVVEAIKKYTEA